MSSMKLSYTKLSKSYESPEQQQEEEEEDDGDQVKRNISSNRIRWLRLRSNGSSKRYWRRPRVIRIARLRRVLKRKVKVVKKAVKKVITRLKEGKPLFGELFAGNYMFMQVTPSPTFLMPPLTDKNMEKFKVLKVKNAGLQHLSLQ